MWQAGRALRKAPQRGRARARAPRRSLRTINILLDSILVLKSLTEFLDEVRGGVVLGVTRDGDPSAQSLHEGGFGNGLRGVVRPLGLHVGPQDLEGLFRPGFGEA